MGLFSKKNETPEQMHESCEKAWGIYDKGKHQKAAELFLPIAEKGFAEAQNAMGILYKNGDGVEQNIEQSIHWFHAAAGQDYAAAFYNLGVIYASEKYGKKDDTRAFAFYLKSAIKGNTKGHYETANCYAEGKGTDKNPELALSHYISAAVKGHTKSDEHLKIHGSDEAYAPYFAKYILPYYEMQGKKGDALCCRMACESYLMGANKDPQKAAAIAKYGAQFGDAYCKGVYEQSLRMG